MGGSGQEHRAFVGGLTSGERLLVTLRDELYEGSWERMLQDLKDRLEKRPYIFKLSSRIEADIAVIGKMRSYEREHGVNIRDHLGGSVEGSPPEGQEA